MKQRFLYIPAFLGLIGMVASGLVHAASLQPSTDYGPKEVVSIVVEALRTNDPAADDDGIATVFRFASPENRRITGPLERFNRMIKSGFTDMLNHAESRIGEAEMRDGVALIPVWLIDATGDRVGYLFRVGRQTSGEYKGMWMTDAVYPMAAPEQGIRL